ncbi:MAG: nucleotidyltransferase domain-containing protein [Nitrosomonas sp.]|nr:nucleotidyltransferase domain-containing protein [Nitrosomonas sp.]
MCAFGSRARRNAKKFSDPDLAIIGEHPIGLDLSSRLAEALPHQTYPIKETLNNSHLSFRTQ